MGPKEAGEGAAVSVGEALTGERGERMTGEGARPVLPFAPTDDVLEEIDGDVDDDGGAEEEDVDDGADDDDDGGVTAAPLKLAVAAGRGAPLKEAMTLKSGGIKGTLFKICNDAVSAL